MGAYMDINHSTGTTYHSDSPHETCSKTFRKVQAISHLTRTMQWTALLTCILLANPSMLMVNAGCKTPDGTPICCRGKQTACSSYTYYHTSDHTPTYHSYRKVPGGPLPGLTSLKPCFCDEHCTSTGDCCEDYREVCHKPIVHCEVGNWGPWSPCDRQCGRGTSVRRRAVTKPALNGGRHCPVMHESTSCEGNICASRRVGRSGALMVPFLHRAQGEVAHLLPKHGDVLQMTREWDMRWDVRRKLYLGRLIKENKTEPKEPDPYCAVYEITHTTSACQVQNPFWSTNSISPAFTESARFGQYIVPQHRYKEFNSANTYAFNRNPHWYRRYKRSLGDAYWNAYAIDSGQDWDTQQTWIQAWASRMTLLTPGKQICVACYPGYMREDLGFRCTGTGLLNLETRWRALRTADCQGRFQMVSMPQRACTCGKGLTSFIFV